MGDYSAESSSNASADAKGDADMQNGFVDTREFLEDIDFESEEIESNSFFDPKVLFGSFIKKQLVKSAMKKSKSLKDLASAVVNNEKEKLKRRGTKIKETIKNDRIAKLLATKKQQFDQKMKYPPFLRTIDKITFTLGIVVMCITEFVLVQKPQFMHTWYTFLIFPLLIMRFSSYHKLKYHYFMLDFCYFCQCMLLIYIYAYPKSEILFKLVFALCSGPLPIGALMWKNSLVFHDLDKMTSVSIHIFPPIVVYCLRWYPQTRFVDYGDGNCIMNWKEALVYPMIAYLYWQAAYYVKTEITDRHKLSNDKDIVTSCRWMAEKKPHPIYKFLVAKGIHVDPVLLLMSVQLVFTLGTLLPGMFLYENWLVHTTYLAAVFTCLIWNGANYYFEVFSESYAKRMKELTIEDGSLQGMSPKLHSFISTVNFMVVVFGLVFVVLHYVA
jgi:hypothetical protein